MIVLVSAALMDGHQNDSRHSYHSYKENFRRDSQPARNRRNIRMIIENITKFGGFQAEYRARSRFKWPPTANLGIGGCVSGFEPAELSPTASRRHR
jgi:hypothetical protein